jgi:hypothetical protein
LASNMVRVKQVNSIDSITTMACALLSCISN